MKYFGQPGMTIIDYENLKKVFAFDDKGEYETNDEKLIRWMKKNKNFIRCEESAKQAEPSDDTKLKHCKKCNFTCENQGELLAHYRAEHKKDGE